MSLVHKSSLFSRYRQIISSVCQRACAPLLFLRRPASARPVRTRRPFIFFTTQSLARSSLTSIQLIYLSLPINPKIVKRPFVHQFYYKRKISKKIKSVSINVASIDEKCQYLIVKTLRGRERERQSSIRHCKICRSSAYIGVTFVSRGC